MLALDNCCQTRTLHHTISTLKIFIVELNNRNLTANGYNKGSISLFMSDPWFARVLVSYPSEDQHNEGSSGSFPWVDGVKRGKAEVDKLNHNIQTLRWRAWLGRESKPDVSTASHQTVLQKEGNRKRNHAKTFLTCLLQWRDQRKLCGGPQKPFIFRLSWQDKNENKRHDHNMKFSKQNPKARET